MKMTNHPNRSKTARFINMISREAGAQGATHWFIRSREGQSPHIYFVYPQEMPRQLFHLRLAPGISYAPGPQVSGTIEPDGVAFMHFGVDVRDGGGAVATHIPDPGTA